MRRDTLGRIFGSMVAAVALAFAATGAMAQTAAGQPAISIAPIILVEPTVETPIPIQVGPIAALPKNTFMRIKGLPAQTTFSDGHAVSAGTWALPLSSLAELKVTLPLAAAGRAELQLALLAIDGSVLAEAKTTLAITAGRLGTATAPAASKLPGRASLGPEPVLQQPPAPVARSAPPPVARVEPPAAPAMKPEVRERALKLLNRGESEMEGGDVAGARLLYQRAAEAGLPEAAMALGMTYDPTELARRGVKGMQGDIEAARKWYTRAQELGAPGAADRIGRLR
ncbi:MAG: hypothetical protein ABL904_27130 [Hyphomicrobiaceae bacterium]